MTAVFRLSKTANTVLTLVCGTQPRPRPPAAYRNRLPPTGVEQANKNPQGAGHPAELLKGLQLPQNVGGQKRLSGKGFLHSSPILSAFLHSSIELVPPLLPVFLGSAPVLRPGRSMSPRVELRGLAPHNSDLWSPEPRRREGTVSLPRTRVLAHFKETWSLQGSSPNPNHPVGWVLLVAFP